MIVNVETGDAALLIGNLLFAGSLFLYGYGRTAPGEKPSETAAAFGGWILEAAVFAACMIRLTGLVIAGIALPEEPDGALQAVRVFFAESMILLYLLWLGPCRKPRILSGEEGYPGAEGESMLAMCLLLVLTLQGRKNQSTGKAFALQLLLLLLFGILLYLRERRNKKHRARMERDSFSIERQKQNEYLHNVDIQYQRTRELWHDLKNHINVLEILAQEERVSELTDYLSSFRQETESRMIPMKTGCTAVDALLSDKLYHAGRQEVKVIYQLCDLSDTRIRQIDLCTVMGNLLDNALEACNRLQEKGRITMKLKLQDDFYYLSVTNPAPEPVIRDGNYISEKKGFDNVAGHGLGLRSVERIAHQYGGSLVTDYRDGEFHVLLRMKNSNGG